MQLLVQLLLFFHHLTQAQNFVLLVVNLLGRFHHQLLLGCGREASLCACIPVQYLGVQHVFPLHLETLNWLRLTAFLTHSQQVLNFIFSLLVSLFFLMLERIVGQNFLVEGYWLPLHPLALRYWIAYDFLEDFFIFLSFWFLVINALALMHDVLRDWKSFLGAFLFLLAVSSVVEAVKRHILWVWRSWMAGGLSGRYFFLLLRSGLSYVSIWNLWSFFLNLLLALILLVLNLNNFPDGCMLDHLREAGFLLDEHKVPLGCLVEIVVTDQY